MMDAPEQQEDEVAKQYDYTLDYMGEVIDVFDTRAEAEQGRRNLVARIKAGRMPHFLDADDIDGESDFTITKWAAGTFH